MNKIYNGLERKINIIQGATLKLDSTTNNSYYVGGEIIATIPSNGFLDARLITGDTTMQYPPVSIIDEIYETERTILVFNTDIRLDPLPEGYDIYIVTPIYAQIYTRIYGPNNKFYSMCAPVFKDNGVLIGYRGIIKWSNEITEV